MGMNPEIHIYLLREIISALESSSEVIRWRGDDSLGTLYIKTTTDLKDCVQATLNAIDKIPPENEVIEAHITRGRFIDQGIETIEISRGVLYEIYIYETETHIYIRIYDLSLDRDSWRAIYCDWSSPSRWWG